MQTNKFNLSGVHRGMLFALNVNELNTRDVISVTLDQCQVSTLHKTNLARSQTKIHLSF